MTTLSAHQPSYLPYPGLFHKIRHCDIFVFLDCVQYEKNGWQNRNKIRTDTGWQWLTVPVHASSGIRIKDVEVSPSKWADTHLKAIMQHYGKSPYLDRIQFLLKVLHEETQTPTNPLWLAALNMFTTLGFMRALNIRTSTMVESVVSPKEYESPDDRLIYFCKELRCDTYLAGPGGLAYMSVEKWEQSGIKVAFQDFHLPEYPQRYPGFVENLSILDLVLNVENPIELLK